MKKLIHTLVLLLCSAVAFAQFPAPYCGPITFSSGIEPITLVNFAGINNASPAIKGIGPHQNFIAITGAVTAGQSYPITLKGNTDGAFTNSFSVFIDWNKNNVFTDLGETFYIGDIFGSTGTDTIKLLGSINVPGYATSGTTRMRVMKIYNNEDPNFLPTPCNTNGATYGQVEEYSLTVTSIAQCLSGVHFPSSVLSTLNCNGGINIVSTLSQTGQYFDAIVTQGKDYVISSSINTDYITVSSNNGSTATFAGTSPLVWNSNVSDTVRFYLHNNINCGIDTIKRTTFIACGTDCLNGALFPVQTYTPAVCDSVTQNLISASASSGQYCNVQVQKGSKYTFSTSVNTDFITLSINGNTAIIKGASPLYWESDTTGVVRFYVNSNQYCATDTIVRSKYISCYNLEVPGCFSNLIPADGDTLYVSVGSYQIGFDWPTTGGPIDVIDFYVGLTPMISFYSASFSPFQLLTLSFDPSDIGQLYYWWLVPSNAAGASTCTPVVHSFKVLASPAVGVDVTKSEQYQVYPNPATNAIHFTNTEGLAELKILNTLGQLILLKKMKESESTVDISELAAGVYQLQLLNKNGKTQTMKIVKQ